MAPQTCTRLVTLPLLAAVLAGCGSTVAMTSSTTVGGAATDPFGEPGAPSAPAVAGGAVPGTGGTAGSTTGLAPTTPGTAVGSAPVASAPGAVRSTAPITIGVVLTGTSNASQFGVSLGNTVSEQAVDQAVVDGLNAKGGLAGRRIKVVYANTDTGSSNWETDFGAACAKFTQDNKVDAVLGYVFNYFSSFESCLSKRGIPHLNTGINIPVRHELRPYPLFLAVNSAIIVRRRMIKLRGATADGVVSRSSKLGVLTDTCPGTQSSLNRTFLPETRRLGLTVTKTIAIGCTNGNGDTGRAVSELQSAELQFASSGVDTVVLHSVSEGPALLLFTLNADSQNYHPKYLVGSLANLDALKSYFPAGQVRNIHAYGWMANQDVPPAAYPKPNAAQKRCLGFLTAKSIKPSTGPDYAYAYNFCEAVFTYEKALLARSGDSGGPGVLTAIRALGPHVESVINNEGSAFGPQLIDAVRGYRHVVWVPARSAFAYTGPVRAVPPA
jgi:hypothetical protein